MNDIEYTYRQEIKERKNTGHSAKYMNRTGKGRTRLPSDNLTEAQKRKLNGEVKTMAMGKPALWEEFTSWPTEIQKEYLINIRENYRATDKMLGAMFGVSSVAVFNKRAKLWDGWTPLKNMSKEDTAARDALWEEFIFGAPAEEPKREELKQEEKKEEPVATEKRKVSVMREINLVLTEARTWDDIMGVLKGYPIPDGCVVSVNIKGGK